MADFLHVLSIAGAALFMVFFFGLCIFVHELGHFLAAKWRGMHVSAFSIGFRKIWGYKYKGVEYRIGWIPFGGYVEIPQVDATGEAKDENGNVLPPVKPLDRMIAVVAGPLFNFIFGFLLAAVIWIHGIPMDTQILKSIEVSRLENKQSPEYTAGLRNGDVITKINGKKIKMTWNEFVKEIILNIGDVTLEGVKKDGKPFRIVYRPAVNPEVLPDEKIAYPFFKPELPLTLYPEKDSPAEKAGVRSGDILLKFNGTPVESLPDFALKMQLSKAKTFTFLVLRDGKEIEIRDIVPKALEIEGRRGVYRLGFTYNPGKSDMEIQELSPGQPAEKAGLKKGDIIQTVNGNAVTSATFSKYLDSSDGKPLTLSILRGKEVRTVHATPEYLAFRDIGLSYAYIAYPTPLEQFNSVMSLTWKSMRGLFYSLGNQIGLTEQSTTIKPSHMSGPIGIGRILYISVYKGSLIEGLNLVVLITFNLGLLNLLPIPVLDGGHFMLALLEIIFRRKISQKFLQPITIVFVTVLIGFMLFVTYWDSKRVYRDFIPAKPADSPAVKKQDPPKKQPVLPANSNDKKNNTKN